MDAKTKLVELYNQQVDWAMKNARLVNDDPEKMKAVHEIFVSLVNNYHTLHALRPESQYKEHEDTRP